MFKRLALFLLIFLCGNVTFSSEIPVNIMPAELITTCNQKNFLEGDYVNFLTTKDVYNGSKLIFKKGAKVQGLITSRVENGFKAKPAELYIEQFKANGKSLDGIIYVKGNSHEKILLEYFLAEFAAIFIPGGEVFIRPTDNFTLFLKD